MKKKIFLVIPDLRCGGAEKVFINLANEWIKNYKVIFILMNKRGEMLNEINHKIEIIDLKISRIRSCFLKFIKIFRTTKNSYFLCAMWPLNSIFLFSSIFGSRSNKYFISEHVNLSKSLNVDFFIPKSFLTLSISFSYIFANKIFCVSNGVKNNVDYLSLFDLKKKLVTIYNPIVDHQPLFYKTKKIVKNKISILSVGTLKHQKNNAVLIKSLSLIENIEDYHLDIVGDGPLRIELEKMSKRLHLQNHITFHGHQNNVNYFYEKADIFVLSSIYEGFGNVLVEALNYGLKIISTDCPNGPSEILSKSKYGLLIPSNDELALKDAIKKIRNLEFDKKLLQNRARDFHIKTISRLYLDEMSL